MPQHTERTLSEGGSNHDPGAGLLAEDSASTECDRESNGSQDLAHHNAYHTLLHPSSALEPRDPLLEVTDSMSETQSLQQMIRDPAEFPRDATSTWQPPHTGSSQDHRSTLSRE